MNHEVLKEIEKALEENKTLQKLTLSEPDNVTLPKVFYRHLMIGIGLNTSLSEVNLHFDPISWYWDISNDGRLVYVSHMLCDSVGCSV